MCIKVTTLIENSLGQNLALQKEHGLSFIIEAGDSRIIFDTGQSGKFIHNADVLNIRLDNITHVVLSHGHYDHSGGFKHLVQRIGNQFAFLITPELLNRKYAYQDMAWQYLGNNFDQKFLDKKQIQTYYIKDDIVEIVPNIYAVRNFNKTCEFELTNERFYIDFDGQYIPDNFNDEVAIVINASKGLVVLLGCSHPGVVNILNTVIDRFGKNIYGVLGGTHLVEADTKRLKLTLEYFNKIYPAFLGISHCTGEKATHELLNSHQPFFINATGTSIFID